MIMLLSTPNPARARQAAGRAGRYGLRDRKTFCMRLKALDAEQLLTNWALAIPRRRFLEKSEEAMRSGSGLGRQF